MSTTATPTIPESLQRLKDEARAAIELRQRQHEAEQKKATEENVRLLGEALLDSVGPEVAALLLWPEVAGATVQAAFELCLEGHLPIWCQMVRETLSTLGVATHTWKRNPYGTRDGAPLLWQVEDRDEWYRTATLGEALLRADLSQHPRSADDEIPF